MSLATTTCIVQSRVRNPICRPARETPDNPEKWIYDKYLTAMGINKHVGVGLSIGREQNRRGNAKKNNNNLIIRKPPLM